MTPALRDNLVLYVPAGCVAVCLQRLIGKLPDRDDHAERNQAVDGHFQDVSALVFRLNQQAVGCSPFHISLSP